MKLEVEMTEEQLNLLILSTEVYARSLMNQPDMVAGILAEDRFLRVFTMLGRLNHIMVARNRLLGSN